MTMKYLTVDGMLSGTGVRDSVEGGYISPQDLGLPAALVERIEKWVSRYEEAHYAGFNDGMENDLLDQEGVALSKLLQQALPEAKIEYFSNARCVKLPLW